MNPVRKGLVKRGLAQSAALSFSVLHWPWSCHQKRQFAPGELRFLTRSTYRRAELFESDRLRLISVLSVGREPHEQKMGKVLPLCS